MRIKLPEIPNAVWIAVIALLVDQLPQQFPGAPWLPIVVVVLMVLGRGLQVYYEEKAKIESSISRDVRAIRKQVSIPDVIRKTLWGSSGAKKR